MSTQRLPALVLTFCLLPLGCGELEPLERDVGEQFALPIVGLLHVLYRRPGWNAQQERGWCGATVIAPRVVITAKSCLAFVERPGDVTFTSELGAATGVAFHQAGEPAAGSRPTYVGWTPSDDLAAIVLDADLPVTEDQLRVVRGEPLDDSHVGRSVVLVGYGVDVISPPGDRRAYTNWITSLGDRTFELSPDGALPCIWDRGDPVFVGAELVGVVSYTFRTPERDRHDRPVYCHTQPITRVDRYLDVLQRALDDAAARTAPPPPTW